MRFILLSFLSFSALATTASGTSTSVVASEPLIYTDINRTDKPIVIRVDTRTPTMKTEVEDTSFSTSDVIAIVAAVLSAVSIAYTRYVDVTNRKASIHDEYWMREVIYPTLMQSFIDYSKDAPKAFRRYNQNAVDYLREEGIDALNNVRDNTPFLNSIEDTLGEQAQGILDSLEEDLQEAQDVGEFKDTLSKASTKLIDLLKSAQEKV